MDKKGSLYNPTPVRGRPVRRRSYTILILAALCLYVVFHVRPLAGIAREKLERPASEAKSSQTTPVVAEGKLVSLEAHIMSKCPDARDCLRDLVVPVMQRVNDKVNFTLSYIGKPTDNDGVECMHGPAECLGNILELCAKRIYPDPKQFLGFTNCLSNRYTEIPERNLIEDCALEFAVDFKELNECATQDDGALGVGMLRDSVRRSSKVCLLMSLEQVS